MVRAKPRDFNLAAGIGDGGLCSRGNNYLFALTVINRRCENAREGRRLDA